MDNLEMIFKGLNVYQAGIVTLKALADLASGSFALFIQGAFLLGFGSIIGALEFTDVANGLAQKYGSFLFSFIGRGLFSVFLGSLVMGHGAMSTIAGLSVMVIGIAYIGLAFVPSIDPPSTMRGENDGFDDDEIEGIV